MTKAFDLISTIQGVLFETANDALPHTYPTFDTPARNEDLGSVFENLNKTYWAGTLPAPSHLKFRPVAAGSLGRTLVKEVGPVKLYNVTVSSAIRLSRAHIVDTLLTEMVKISAEEGGDPAEETKRLVEAGFFRSRNSEAA